MKRTYASLTLFSTLFGLLSVLTYFYGNDLITGDDTWGATAVLGNPLEVIIFTLRWDLHPPLYYSVLDLWAILGKSDIWLRMSSLFCHSLVTVIGFNYVIKREGTLAALITALIIFTSPLLFEYSTKIRMYSFVSLLSVIIFINVNNYIYNNRNNLKTIFILGFILSYSHAIGILFVFFHFLYGLFNLRARNRGVESWIYMHAVLAILSVPVILNSALKGVSHAGKPSIENIIYIVQHFFISGHVYFSLLALVMFVIILMCKSVRTIAFFYIIVPIVMFAIISYTIKPLWLQRNFIFSVPIIVIAFGISISRLNIIPIFKFVLISIILSVNITNSTLFNNILSGQKKNPFDDVVNVLKENIGSTKTCIISTNTLDTFWSLQRYINKVEWGNPTEIQPPLSERWGQIAKRIPPFFAYGLKLETYPHYTETENLIIASGNNSRCKQADIEAIYIVGTKRDIIDSNLIFENTKYSVYGEIYEHSTLVKNKKM